MIQVEGDLNQAFSFNQNRSLNLSATGLSTCAGSEVHFAVTMTQVERTIKTL